MSFSNKIIIIIVCDSSITKIGYTEFSDLVRRYKKHLFLFRIWGAAHFSVS